MNEARRRAEEARRQEILNKVADAVAAKTAEFQLERETLSRELTEQREAYAALLNDCHEKEERIHAYERELALYRTALRDIHLIVDEHHLTS